MDQSNSKKCIKCDKVKSIEDFIWQVTDKEYKTCSSCKDYVHEMERSIPAGVYQIKDKTNNEVLYVGESYIPYRRRKEHLSVYKDWNSVKHKSLITKAIYDGELDRENLIFEMIVEGIDSEKERKKLERDFIEKLNPKYNKDKPNPNIKKWIK